MSLSAFLAENAVPVENIKFVASKRFFRLLCFAPP